MLHELLAFGEYADFVVGTSASAINAAFLPARPIRAA